MIKAQSNRVKAIIFDYDGTLLDSMGAWHTLERDLAQMAGITLDAAEKNRLNAFTLSQLVAYFHNTYGIGRSYQALFEEARAQLLNKYRNEIQPKKGALELLARLKDDGVKLALASASPLFLIEAGLKRFDIYDAFDVIASADQESTSKQNPHFLQAVAQALNSETCDIWGIDDSVYALDAMNQLGFSTIGIYDSDAAGTFSELQKCANFAVHDLSDLDYETFINKGYA